VSIVFDPSAWIYKYYIYPFVYDTSYNPIDTITWAIVLGLAILGLKNLLRYFGQVVDERLVLCTLSYILAGSSLRVMEDANLFTTPWKYLFITPLIFFFVLIVTLVCFILTKKIGGEDFCRSYAVIGLVWTFFNLIILFQLGFKNAWVILAVFLLGSTITGGVLLINRIAPRLNFLGDKFNIMILYAHMLDSSSTYIGVDWFSYYEKHVVPSYLIDLTGSAIVMFPLKLLILLPVLSIIDKSLEEPSLRNLTKLTLITLGLAPAIRNTLRLALGI
jgi:uncharacterized membrane protein